MKLIQKPGVAVLISLIFFLASTTSYCQQNSSSVDRKEFYSAMASKDLKKVNEQLERLKKTGISEKNAYEGTLIMKKAGLVSGAGKKLGFFKKGREQLEAAIAKDDNNAEFRFLRLMIQEHAPGILGYKDDLDKDSAYIRQSFKRLPVEVQEAITDYSKTSKVLRSEDF